MQLFSTVGRIVTGAGCFAALGNLAAGLGSKCLIVSGKKAMQEQGYITRVEEMLNAAGISTCVLLGIGSDPDITDIQTGVALFREKSCDMALGIGGGSAIDAAKAIAKFAAAECDIRAVFDGAEFPAEGHPVIAIPSTFGTGTEVTRVSVLSDRARKLKRGLRHDSMLPRIALVDPELGAQTPAGVVARSGLDAITQAIESFFSRFATDITEALAFNALVLLADGLPRLLRNPQDSDARSNCANGSLMAGMAFSNSRLGLVHGLAHPLGARYHIAHGEVCGITLPHVLRFNQPAEPKKYALISGILGMDAADWTVQRLRDFDLPTNLRALTISAVDCAAIIDEALASGSTQANCRPVSAGDVERILNDLTGA